MRSLPRHYPPARSGDRLTATIPPSATGSPAATPPATDEIAPPSAAPTAAPNAAALRATPEHLRALDTNFIGFLH